MEIKISKEDAAILSGAYAQEDRISAVKLGFAHAIADAGLTPSEAEGLFRKAAIQKVAAASPGMMSALPLASIGEWAMKYPVLLALLGAGAGAGIGKLHNSLESRSEDKIDEESTTLKKKEKTFRRMKQELAEAMGAGSGSV